MKIKTIAVTYGRKFNLGDYNSANIECTAWAELEEGDDPAAATKTLFEEAKAAVKEQALPLAKKANAQITAFVAGLPAEVQATIPPTTN